MTEQRTSQQRFSGASIITATVATTGPCGGDGGHGGRSVFTLQNDAGFSAHVRVDGEGQTTHCKYVDLLELEVHGDDEAERLIDALAWAARELARLYGTTPPDQRTWQLKPRIYQCRLSQLVHVRGGLKACLFADVEFAASPTNGMTIKCPYGEAQIIRVALSLEDTDIEVWVEPVLLASDAEWETWRILYKGDGWSVIPIKSDDIQHLPKDVLARSPRCLDT